MVTDRDLAPAALRGKRAGLAMVILLAVVFIGATAYRVVPAVFGLAIAPVPAGTCAEGLRALEVDVKDADKAPTYASLREVCTRTPGGFANTAVHRGICATAGRRRFQAGAGALPRLDAGRL